MSLIDCRVSHFGEPKLVDGVRPIHTSDRIGFKRCRRKWAFQSPLRGHLTRKEGSKSALWFGTGFHYALEDFHGYNNFHSNPQAAFVAYSKAFRQEHLPHDFESLVDLGLGMIDHYISWLKRREQYQTYWVDGVPQVEVRFSVPIPELSEYAGEPVHYHGTFDRVVEDEEGRLWILDYKTAAQIDTGKLETDPQVTSYLWAGEHLYDRPIEGVIYMQFVKSFPVYPKMTKKGVSFDKRQKTNHALYEEVLELEYGSIQKSPAGCIEMLNLLLDQEDIDSDRYIRRDLVRRNHEFRTMEGDKIVAEGYDMLNPNLAIYPNPTRDCSWDCDFRTVCLAMDDGSDWEQMLIDGYEEKGEEIEWRHRIKLPTPEEMQTWQRPAPLLPQLEELEVE
jgi:hypothetical protein